MSREAMKQALETLEQISDEMFSPYGDPPISNAILALRAALDAPLYRRGTIVRCLESDELATVYTTSIDGDAWVKWPDGSIGTYTSEQMGKAFAIEPKWQEPEPVWIQSTHLDWARREPSMCRLEPTQRLPDFVPLYAGSREWVDITDGELFDLWMKSPAETEDKFAFVKAALAKQKEKNT